MNPFCISLLLSVAVQATPPRMSGGDTTIVDSIAVSSGPNRLPARPWVLSAPTPITRQEAATRAEPIQAIEYSDWYERRVTIHKWASYTTLPLFAFQYFAGRELYDESTDAPGWAKNGHGVAATGIAALFGVNTVTGVWNLWDARKDPEGRKTRTTHGLLMLAADAGFVATGMLAENAERSPDNRALHRNIAISSMAVATASYLMMLPPFRRD